MLPRAYFTFVSSVADETKVTKNQVGANAFLNYWVVGTTQQSKTRIGQSVLQPDIVCFFIEFSGLVLFRKGPLLYAGASAILKRCLRLVIFFVFLKLFVLIFYLMKSH